VVTVASRAVPIDDLVVYCVGEIISNSEECTFERLVYECFTRFPDVFGLNRYPEWPDSARVNKAWLRCRTDKGLIVGSVQEGFTLTPEGERLAHATGTRLGMGRTPGKPPGAGVRTRERHEGLLRTARNSPLFKRFRAGKLNASDMELREFLGATLETPLRVLRQNLHAYRSAAQAYGDAQVVDFFAACEKILTSQNAQTAG